MKKGFTLIELLAVIIILAIIALIATPIILDVVNDAKDSAAKSEASMIVSGVNNYCAASSMKEQLNGITDICKDGVTKEEVSTMVDLGNAKVNSITYDKKVTSLEIESNGRTVKYNGSTYTINGEVEDIPEQTPTYAAYSVGDEVTLTDGTTWVVVKNTDSSESEIRLMSTQNVKANLTEEEGKEIFTINQNEYALAYDNSGNNSNIWNNSTIKTYLDGTVKTRLEESLNTKISDITIWGLEELTILGCTLTGNDVDGYSAVSCDGTKTWYSKVFQNSFSWLKLPTAGYNYRVWYVNDDGTFDVRYVETNDSYGARPVITVSKNVIVKKYYAFGTPTTSSSTNYQDVINTSKSNVFVKLEGEQLSLCIYKEDTLTCFKNNNYEEEKINVQPLFENCAQHETSMYCYDNEFSCNIHDNGYVNCKDFINVRACDVSEIDHVSCVTEF